MKLTEAQQGMIADLFGRQPLPPRQWTLKALTRWDFTDDSGAKVSGSGYSFHDTHDAPLPFPGVGRPAPEAFIFKVAGVTYHPDQLQNEAFQPGRHLTLIPEPENINDTNAVAVWDDAQQLQIGHVPKEMAEGVAVALRQGHIRDAICVWQWRKEGKRVGVEAFVAPSLSGLTFIDQASASGEPPQVLNEKGGHQKRGQTKPGTP
jgi:hypothetical protein